MLYWVLELSIRQWYLKGEWDEFLNKMKNVIQLWFIKEIVGSLDSSVTFPVTVCLKEDYFSANMELWTNLVALRAFVSATRLERAVVKPIVLCISTCLPPVFHYRWGTGLRKLLSAWSQPWWERGHCRGNWGLSVEEAHCLIEHISRGNGLGGPKVLGWLLLWLKSLWAISEKPIL